MFLILKCPYCTTLEHANLGLFVSVARKQINKAMKEVLHICNDT